MKSDSYTWLPADTPDMSLPNLQIVAANGSYLTTVDGVDIYDAISSWWCKPLGHRHPLVINSILEQLELFEHHIPANAWNTTIEALSKRIVNIFTQMDKVIYASDGSCAIEIAMKLSYETRVLHNQAHRSKFIALSGAYHGETILALSVCGIKNYTHNYSALIPENHFVQNVIYVSGCDDPLWHECNFDHNYWEEFFSKHASVSTALIIEPLVQGANGVKVISRDFLIRLIELAKQYDLHIIADEIMVGLGRLGCYSVSKEMLNCEPDLVCFGKNLTAGSIPMSAVVVNRSISNVYRAENRIFPHSHTHSCNALATNVALNYLKLLDNSDLLSQVKLAEIKLISLMQKLKKKFIFIDKIRVIGAIAGFELNLPEFIICRIFAVAIQERIYLRPIGRTLYIMPPLYNIITELDLIYARLYNVLSNGRIIV